jgi:hypothetical protein
MKKRLLYLLALWPFCLTAQVQEQTLLAKDSTIQKPQHKQRMLQVGLSANAYRGDLTFKYATWTPAFQAGLLFNRKKNWNGSLLISSGKVTGQQLGYTYGDGSSNATPNDYFSTTFFTLGYQLQGNLVKTKRWNWYIAQGFELMRFTPHDRDNKKLADQKNTRDKNESYGKSTLALPSSMGLSYTLNNGLAICIKAGWRNPNSDYIDNISRLSKSVQKDNIAFFMWALNVPIKIKKQKQN